MALKKNTMKRLGIQSFWLLFIGLTFFSCSKSEDFSGFVEQEIEIEEEEIVSALVVRTRSLRNQSIDFQVLDAEGTDVSAEATFYVDGEMISGSSFSSENTGSFEVYAEYEVEGTMVTTEVESFEVIIPKRKIVIEDYTGAWCGYCPRISAAIDAVHEETDHIAVVAIHNDDDMALPFEEDLRETFEVFGFPSGRINRTQNWGNPHPAEAVTDIAGLNTNSAIAISSELNGTSLTVKVKLVSEEDLNNHKLVVYLVEDGILSEQVNYFDQDPSSPYYQQGNPIIDFVNNDVLRASLTGILGDNIPATSSLTEYSRVLNANIDPSFNVDNLRLVAMLVQDDNTALNAQTAAVTTVKDYE